MRHAQSKPRVYLNEAMGMAALAGQLFWELLETPIPDGMGAPPDALLAGCDVEWPLFHIDTALERHLRCDLNRPPCATAMRRAVDAHEFHPIKCRYAETTRLSLNSPASSIIG